MRNNLRKSLLENISGDGIVMLGAVLYLIIPIALFMLGWVRLWLALPFCAVLIFFIYRIMPAFNCQKDRLFSRANRSYWMFTSMIGAFWTYLSGIGGLVYQNEDFVGRNPMFRDLSTYEWPMFYDLSYASDLVREYCGDETVGFSYYFTWWLPSSWLAKVFDLSENARNFLLGLWAFIGIMLVIYILNRLIGKCSYIVPTILIFFSGLDIIPYLIKNGWPGTVHIEWWAEFFQYSSNTTQIFWVFNQTIPLWIITGIFLLLKKDNRYMAALLSLAFAYSPWATICLVPLAIAGSIGRRAKFSRVFNVANIAVPAVMLTVFGLFYMSGSGAEGTYGFLFITYLGMWKYLFANYFVFIIVEFLIYFFVLGKHVIKEPYFLIVITELMVLPMITIRDFNFTMRGCIPALFILMYYVIDYLVHNYSGKNELIRRRVLIIVLCIGAITPTIEITRTVRATMLNEPRLIKDDVYSFGDMQTDSDMMIELYRDQFFVYDYEETPFYKYIGKY